MTDLENYLTQGEHRRSNYETEFKMIYSGSGTRSDTNLIYNDSSLSPDTIYYYKLKAGNDAGTSNFSSDVSERSRVK